MNGAVAEKRQRLVTVAASIFAAVLLSACGTNDTSRVGVFVSPDGSLIADWYQESGGGAASASADYVQIRKRGERFSPRSDYVFEGISGDVLKISWKGNSELEVVYPSMTTVTRSEARWNNVSITYREDPQLRERGY